MAKAAAGRLTKIKSALKRLPSFGKLSRASSGVSMGTASGGGEDLHPVYVGKSRRLYLVPGAVVEHPIFQELVHRSGGTAAEEGVDVACCEVVLFEHLLWMLQNAEETSMNDLADFYAC